MSNNIEMIIKKYDMLKSTNDLLNVFSDQFDDDVESFCQDNDIELNKIEAERKMEDGEVALEDDVNSFEMTENMKEVMKKEYKDISKKTHPDKTDSNLFTNKIFKDMSEAYSEQNIFEIIKISFDFFEKTSFDLTKEEEEHMLKYLETAIEFLKSDKIWNWKYKSASQKAKEIFGVLRALKVIR